MRYIGNKAKLLEFINKPLIKRNITSGVLCDIFSGTTSVAKYFKKKGFQIISNDNMEFSYVFQKAYIENNEIPTFEGLQITIRQPNIENVFKYLNNLSGVEGFMYKNFSMIGSKSFSHQRNYFSEDNAKKIDAIREQIEKWKKEKDITEMEFYILLCAIIEEIPFVSNIAGTYGAFLKTNDPRKSLPFKIEVPELIESSLPHASYQMDANKLIRKIKCDVLYVDPPYNERQYPSNYHMFETVSVWDKKLLDTKTGLRPWSHQKSEYCVKSKCVDVFEDLITNANCKYILFSYNSEGLIPYKEIVRILKKRGKVSEDRQDYRRFKSNSRGKKPRKDLQELLFFVETS